MSGKDHAPLLNVVLYWHMHQPEYRNLRDNVYNQPWTYLHTIKDYVDMAGHLEECTEARAVVNFAPVLLEQIADYADQLDGYLHHGKALRDPLLSALAEPVLSLVHDKRMFIVKSCLRANRIRLVDRFPAFQSLVELADSALENPTTMAYYSEQYFADLLVWYHLAWMAETVRRTDTRIMRLMKKAEHFTMHDRHLLVEILGELIGGIINRYRKLAEAGRIELSMTPYAHPIVPLLIDFSSARQAMPDAPLPLAAEYPGGAERSLWHMKKGMEVFRNFFGFDPKGCWPSEGSISEETLELMSASGIRWIASGETVLRNSLGNKHAEPDLCIQQTYQFKEFDTACFFRDDGLSDCIGFRYADWHADDAVANLVHNLEKIAQSCADKPDAIVSIILDGENAWEYYPENGFHFISALYRKLSRHEALKLTTYSDYLDTHTHRAPLNRIVAGSWVYGTFSTWIGDRDKNRAWDMLVDAKKVYDRLRQEDRLPANHLAAIEMQLATCESSDWFWWFGDYNSAESVAAFDEQFRLHLSNLYQLMNEEPPDYLSKAFSFGSGHPAMGGTMLPGQRQ